MPCLACCLHYTAVLYPAKLKLGYPCTGIMRPASITDAHHAVFSMDATHATVEGSIYFSEDPHVTSSAPSPPNSFFSKLTVQLDEQIHGVGIQTSRYGNNTNRIRTTWFNPIPTPNIVLRSTSLTPSGLFPYRDRGGAKCVKEPRRSDNVLAKKMRFVFNTSIVARIHAACNTNTG